MGINGFGASLKWPIKELPPVLASLLSSGGWGKMLKKDNWLCMSAYIYGQQLSSKLTCLLVSDEHAHKQPSGSGCDSSLHAYFTSNLGLRKSKVLDKGCSEWMSKDFYVVTNISVVQIFDFVPIICWKTYLKGIIWYPVWKAGMIIAGNHEIVKS